LAEKILTEHGGINVRSYEGEANAFADLKNERLDAVLVDEPIAIYQASWNPDFKLTGEPIGKVIYACAMRLEDTLLLQKVNFAIESMIKTKKLKDILCEWNLWNALTAEELLDYTDCDVYASKFHEFVATQKEEMTFLRLMERYLGLLPELGKAAIMTLQLSVMSMVLAIIVGLFIVITKVYAPRPFSDIANIYIEFVRGTPLLVQLYLIFYGLPNIGIKLHPIVAAVLTLAINYSAYEAENFRAGLNSIQKGQFEAAISLGMSRFQALRYVIIPQAGRLVIPPVTNDFISLLKDSSLVSVITLVELTKKYLQLASAYYDFIGIGIIVALFYLILGLPFVKLSKYTEKRLNIYLNNHNNLK
jgi:polar amino acid transport system substrate-binding protein